MTSWTGQGLPPVAAARVDRFASSGLRTSLLSAAAAYSVESVGFEPIGEVMGCIVERISFAGYGGSGSYLGSPAAGYVAQVVTSDNRYYGFGPLVSAMTRGWNTAMSRLQLEATALGADGVVAISLTQNHLDHDTREFVAIGTAVRARTRHRHQLPAPFTTDLDGGDFAKLMLSGWVPVAVRIGYEVAVRADDYASQRQSGSRWTNTANVEVSGYTELVERTRARARDRFATAIRQANADGGIVSGLSLRVWENGEASHAAEATIRGTAVAAFGRRGASSPPAPLTIMPTRPFRSMKRDR